jgi:hypothetical protein
MGSFCGQAMPDGATIPRESAGRILLRSGHAGIVNAVQRASPEVAERRSKGEKL